jgi:hypothetical protein
MLTATCAACSCNLSFDATEAGRIAVCPHCGAHQCLIPDQILAVCGVLKHSQLSYCQQLRDHFREDNVQGIKLHKRAWKATMSSEVGAYLFFRMEDLQQELPQPPLTSLLLNTLARDTILLNTTPTTAIIREQIAQVRRTIEHRAYGTLPSADCRQLLDHLLDAIQYRLQKYTTCRCKGETYGHVASCCWSRLEDFLNRSTDDLSRIVVEDGPLTGGGGFFDSVYLREFLADMENALVIPYQCVLQNLFEAKSDLLALDLSEVNAIIEETLIDCQSKLNELQAARQA